jgi:hypothetical protein
MYKRDKGKEEKWRGMMITQTNGTYQMDYP